LIGSHREFCSVAASGCYWVSPELALKLIGIDTGVTSTDLALWRYGQIQVHKVLSTAQAPERAIVRGNLDLGLDPSGLRVIHGSTVAWLGSGWTARLDDAGNLHLARS
jgi:hypothetical protein